jgi:hypothetical protein
MIRTGATDTLALSRFAMSPAAPQYPRPNAEICGGAEIS